MRTDPDQPALEERFTPVDHDPLILTALLTDEVIQRRESGYDVDDFVRSANRLETDDRDGILALVDGMWEAPRREWSWEEPESLDDIEASLVGGPPKSTAADSVAHADRVHAAWLGRIAGCNLGKPVEWGDHWTVSHIADYLRRADAYPLTDYIPVLDPMPDEFDLNASWIHSTRGRVDGSARDDDIDYAILALHLLETHGAALTPTLVGDAWTEMFPLRQVFTAERSAYINLTNGIEAPLTARVRNPYREWIGAQIRGDVFGYVHPGDPWSAASLAYRDATLSHTANGVYGEMWAAALVAAAFTESDARSAVELSLGVVPPQSRLAAAIRFVIALRDEGLGWEAARARIAEEYGRYAWVHTINNAAVVTLGLLWGEGDFTTAVGRTVMSGLDTDSNGATVGSVAGILAGTAGLPERLVSPLHDRTRSALFGFDGSRISDLASRTVAVRGSVTER
ncbi:ADP-ribosylglycohydrolase family protein [Microbacterium sp.]|uniref:ADP-ribosylglycohydrolase family protein n=1 Tax=Microbacterium sp. TaxID=51671 RepID=UPI003561F64A